MLIVIDCGSHLVNNIYDYLDEKQIHYQSLPLKTDNADEIFTQLKKLNPQGIIISGSGDHIHKGGRILPTEFKDWLLETKTPTFGICYGHQMLGKLFNGEINSNPMGFEELNCKITVNRTGYPLFKDLPNVFDVFMVHFDIISTLPDKFQNFGTTKKTRYAAIQLYSKANEPSEPLPIFGVQFHPEKSKKLVKEKIFENFLAVCGLYIKN